MFKWVMHLLCVCGGGGGVQGIKWDCLTVTNTNNMRLWEWERDLLRLRCLCKIGWFFEFNGLRTSSNATSSRRLKGCLILTVMTCNANTDRGWNHLVILDTFIIFPRARKWMVCVRLWTPVSRTPMTLSLTTFTWTWTASSTLAATQKTSQCLSWQFSCLVNG